MQIHDSAGDLLQEVTADDLIEPTNRRIRILFDHISRRLVLSQRGTLLDECGQVSQLTEFHHQMHLCLGLEAVEQGDDVGMVEFPEDLDFFVEVLPQLLAELREVYRLDGNERAFLLCTASNVSGNSTVIVIFTERPSNLMKQDGCGPRTICTPL